MVLHAGTNKLPHETSTRVIDRFDKVIDNIRQGVPGIMLFVLAILPRDISFFPGAKNNLSFIDQCNGHADAMLCARGRTLF